MNLDEIEIKVIAAADRNAVKKLYQEAGWWRSGDESADGCAWIDALVRQSFCFVGAFRDGELIGMGRAISDGVERRLYPGCRGSEKVPPGRDRRPHHRETRSNF